MAQSERGFWGNILDLTREGLAGVLAIELAKRRLELEPERGSVPMYVDADGIPHPMGSVRRPVVQPVTPARDDRWMLAALALGAVLIIVMVR